VGKANSLLLAGLLGLAPWAGCASRDSGPALASSLDARPSADPKKPKFAGAASKSNPLTDNAFTGAISSAWNKVTKPSRSSAGSGLAPDPISLAHPTGPVNPGLYLAAARLQEDNQEYEAAEKSYRQVLEMDAHNIEALAGLAHIYDRQDQMQKAIGWYQLAVQHHPLAAQVHNDLGICLARQSRYQEALQSLGQSVQLQPDRPLYRNNIATVLIEVGQIDAALQHLGHVHGPAEAHYNAGFLLHQRGRNEEAVQQFQLALQVNPNMQPARQWLARLEQPAQAAPGMTPQQVRQSYLPRSGQVPQQATIRRQSYEYEVESQPAPAPNLTITDEPASAPQTHYAGDLEPPQRLQHVPFARPVTTDANSAPQPIQLQSEPEQLQHPAPTQDMQYPTPAAQPPMPGAA